MPGTKGAVHRILDLTRRLLLRYREHISSRLGGESSKWIGLVDDTWNVSFVLRGLVHTAKEEIRSWSGAA